MKSELCKRCADIYCCMFNTQVTECQDFRPMTNADRIRAMTDEELADFITRQRFASVNAVADKLGIDVSSMFLIGCKNMLNWLKQEAERSEE